MKAISIDVARQLGKNADARQLVIIALDGEDYSITTWGKTREECRALAGWAESDIAIAVLHSIAGRQLGPVYVARGERQTALDPDTKTAD